MNKLSLAAEAVLDARMTAPRRFYFTIKAANVVECVQAHSLTEAKLIAADTWLPWWNQIEWLNPESVTDPNVYL